MDKKEKVGTKIKEGAKKIVKTGKKVLDYVYSKTPDVTISKGDAKVHLSIPRSNHPTWYENYDLDKMVNLNFGYRNSVENRLDRIFNVDGGDNDGLETTVGARVNIELVVPKDQNNSFGQAIQILYTKLRAANSGSVNYSLQDLTTYVLNLRSVRAALTQLRRTVSLTHYSNAYDADAPRMLVELSSGSEINNLDGVPFDEITKNSADIYNYLNIWFNAVKSLCPLNIDLFDRTDWMLANVFKDSNDMKANFYVFNVQQVPIYTINDNGAIIASHIDLSPKTESWDGNYTQFMTNMNTIVNSMLNNGTYAIIAGDILKAFGDDAFYTQEAFKVGEFIAPIYDEAALTQIQNAIVLGCGNAAVTSEYYTLSGGNSMYITMDAPRLSNLITRNPSATVVNSYKNELTPGETISYTRLQCFGKYTGDNDRFTVELCGTEIVRNIKYAHKLEEYSGAYGYAFIGWNDVTLDGFLSGVARVMNAWSVMDYSPLFWMSDPSATTVQWDFNNYAVCDKSQLSQLHQYATLSLMAVRKEISRQTKFQFAR